MTRSLKVSAIVAMDEARVIGNNGKLPWHIPEDMKRFATLTKGHTVLMGRKTYESLPPKYRPLPERKNIVVSRSFVAPAGVEVWETPSKCIDHYKTQKGEGLPTDQLWIIGGAQIYQATKMYWDEVHLTLVNGVHEGDTWFDAFEDDFELATEERFTSCVFKVFLRKKE